MFDNFISLGGNCVTASSMAKFGLRSFSGPFDWCTSDYEGVIQTMENQFSDFLKKENLTVSHGGGDFEDIKYGFQFSHDVKRSFDEDYEEIYSKYMRRIKRFCMEIKKRTCFIRAVRHEDEVLYISKNLEYINNVIKKGNPENEVVYLLLKFFPELPSGAHYYRLKVEKYVDVGRTKDLLKSAFDTASEFIAFFEKNFDAMTRSRNIIFDLESSLRKEKMINSDLRLLLEKFQQKFQLFIKIEQTEFGSISFPEDLIIYGAGSIGKLFYDKVKHLCSITCFVDEFTEEKEYDGTPIVKMKGLGNTDQMIIVTPTYDYEKIAASLRQTDENRRNIVSLDEIL